MVLDRTKKARLFGKTGFFHYKSCIFSGNSKKKSANPFSGGNLPTPQCPIHPNWVITPTPRTWDDERQWPMEKTRNDRAEEFALNQSPSALPPARNVLATSVARMAWPLHSLGIATDILHSNSCAIPICTRIKPCHSILFL